eukprot:UN01457
MDSTLNQNNHSDQEINELLKTENIGDSNENEESDTIELHIQNEKEKTEKEEQESLEKK